MKLSEAIREWKRNITTNMAVEYVLTLRADINAFSDAAQALERENAKLRELMADMRRYGMCECEHKDDCQTCEFAFPRRMRELGLEWGDFNV